MSDYQNTWKHLIAYLCFNGCWSNASQEKKWGQCSKKCFTAIICLALEKAHFLKLKTIQWNIEQNKNTDGIQSLPNVYFCLKSISLHSSSSFFYEFNQRFISVIALSIAIILIDGVSRKHVFKVLPNLMIICLLRNQTYFARLKTAQV